MSAWVLEPLLTMLEPGEYLVYQFFDDPLFGVVAVRRSLLTQVPLEVLLDAARDELAQVVESEGYWAGSVTVGEASELVPHVRPAEQPGE